MACLRESIDDRTEVITVVDPGRSDNRQLERQIVESIASGKRGLVVDLSLISELEPRLLFTLGRWNDRLGWRNGRMAIVWRRASAGTNGVSEFDGFLFGGFLDVYSTREQALSELGAEYSPVSG
jgi:hypothetical protein